jgi:hypothetical protein
MELGLRGEPGRQPKQPLNTMHYGGDDDGTVRAQIRAHFTGRAVTLNRWRYRRKRFPIPLYYSVCYLGEAAAIAH